METFWNERKESLSRAQVLSRRGPHQQTYDVHRGHRDRKFRGRYSRTPPSQLPSLNTLPQHNLLRSDSDLRRGHYHRVPPLDRKPSSTSSNGNDSWDEDSFSDDSVERVSDPGGAPPTATSHPAPTTVHHHHYPPPPAPPQPPAMPPYYMYPPYHSPYYPPPTYPPVPASHEPKTTPRTKQKHTRERKPKKRVHYADERRSQEPRAGQQMFQYIDLQPDAEFEPVDQRPVKAQAPPPSQHALLLKDISHSFTTTSPFALNYVDTFIHDYLDEEMIPDALIDVLQQEEKERSMKEHLERGPSFEAGMDLLDLEVSLNIREVIQEVLEEAATHYMGGGMLLQDAPIASCAEDVLTETLDDLTDDIVKETVDEMVEQHLWRAAAYDSLMTVLTDVMHEEAPNLLEEVTEEIILEEILEDEVIEGEVNRLCAEVALETMQHYDDKIRRKQIKLISEHSDPKLVEGMMLDYLLHMIARQGLMTEQEATDKLLDNLSLTVLLSQAFSVDHARQATMQNNILRRHHEKVVTDITLDVLLDELQANLDEDLCELDEWERGFDVEMGASLPAGVPICD